LNQWRTIDTMRRLADTENCARQGRTNARPCDGTFKFVLDVHAPDG
jgi:hypothetical protein